jgi:hypothetical protein
MGRARWVGRHLWNLLNLPVSELVVLYPEYSRDTIKGKKAYWKQKLKEGKITMPEKPAEQPQVTEGRLVKSWEVAMRGQDGEWDTTTLHSYSHTIIDEETFPPAAPARITPSRRKPAVRDHKLLFVFSDAQIDYRRLPSGELEPIHDERAIRVAQMLCRDLQPDEILNLGDTVDLAALSRFKPDSDHFHRTLGPSFQRVHDMYAQFRADNPRAKIVEVDSNHNTRLKDFMLKNAPDLYGIKRPGDPEDEYPMFTYPYFTNLSHVGVEWVSGYGAAEYVYGQEYDAPPIVFKHGKIVASQSSTAARESKANPETHIVRGHGHRMEMHTRTNRAGQYLVSMQIGALCRTTGEVPSYHSAVDDKGNVVQYQEDWQQGVLIIRDYEGQYEFQPIYIRDGVALHNGKVYNAE